MRIYFCDICKAQKIEVTTRCHAIEGSPCLCKDCLLSDYHVVTVHGDNLAALMCTIGGGIEELIRRRGGAIGENRQ